MDARKICLQISEGKISEVKDFIVSYNGEIIDYKVALSILITLCRTLSQNDSVSINDSFELTIICCKSLTGLKDADKDNFLLSLYHVTKYLCKHKLYCKVLKLLEYIKQHCENFKSDVYNYYVALFHNHILQNTSDLTSDIILAIVCYSLHFQILLKKEDYSSLILKFKQYPSIFTCSNVNNLHRTQFCAEILKIFENLPVSENKDDVLGTFSVLLKILTVIIQRLARCEDENFPDLVTEQFGQTCAMMRKHCKSEEYVNCIEILQNLSLAIVKNLKSRTISDLNVLIETGKQLKASIRKRGSNAVVVASCCLIAKILRSLFEYFQNCKDLWSKYLCIKTQTELLQMVEVLGQFLSKTTIEIEKCCGFCKLKTNIYHATVLTSCVGILTNNTLRMDMPCPEEFLILSLRCLKMSCKFLNHLKDAGCEKYVIIWRVVGAAIYNTAVILYRSKEYKFAKIYAHLMITNLISLEGVKNPELCFQDSLGASLHLYATNCSFLQEKKECMLYLSLTMLLSPEYKRKAFQLWIMLKSNDEDSIKSITLYDLLFKKQESIKEIYPDYIYNRKVVEDLLMDELLYYYENWQSKMALKSVCNALCDISTNLIYRTRCFVSTWEKVIHLFDDDYIKNLEATIELMKSTTNINLKMCLSVLYYIEYQYRMNEIIDKNIVDMNEAYIPLKSTPLQPYEEPPNPNDKCDIVPAFYNMKIDNLLKIYKILDQSVEIWNTLLNDNNCQLDPNVVSTLNFYHFIKATAYEYRMQHFDVKMLKTWILYYKLSKQFNNKTEIVTSIGFIIEYSDCKSESSKALISEAEYLLLDFNLKDSEHLEAYLTYYINKSNGYLKNDMIELGYSTLCAAEKYMDEANEAKLKICEARILHLKTCYMMLPCKNKIINHNENFLIIAQNSFSIIAEYYTTKTHKNSYLISILFEISLANGWIYKWLRLPREVRCYSKETIFLAQKCLLPIRTAQFLSLLAFTDLLDMQYSDCEVKLNGLTTMLCYASHEIYEKLPMQTEILEDFKLESPNCELSELDNSIPMIQTVLDIPVAMKMTNKTMMGSPELRRKSFVLPEFMKHSDGCDCFMCSNCEYQKLILDSIHLEALLNLYQGISEYGEDYFKGGLTLYDKLRKKSKLFTYKSVRFTENKVVFANLYKNISQGYCNFLLDYSYFLVKRSALNDAKKVVDNIFKLLSNVKHVNNYFWSELMIQKFNLYFEDEVKEEKAVDENTLQVSVDASQPVTPKNKMSNTNIYLAVTPACKSKQVKVLKKLTFDLSEDEKDENLSKTPEQNKNAFFKFQTPAKTPAPVPPKIKIYTPKTVKPKRTISKTTTAPAPGNSEVKKTVNKQLEERTKLLTEKLKAEKKTVLKDCSNIDNLNNHLSKEAHKIEVTETSTVRKKLLDDLDEVTETVEKLTINSKENETTKFKLGLKKVTTSNEKTVEKKYKKYTRIIEPSSSSDSSSDSIGVRKSSRIRKCEKKLNN